MKTTLSNRARRALGQWKARIAAENVAEARTPSVMGGRYDGAELRPDPSIHPSRMGDTLHWPDGRVTDLDDNEVTR